MRDVFGTGSNVAIVMDFMDTDLEVIIKDTSIILTPAHIKTYILQTLRGLEYLHQNWILHRLVLKIELSTNGKIQKNSNISIYTEQILCIHNAH